MEKSQKGVEFTSSSYLSKTQKQILDMIFVDHLTIKKIAKQRGTSEAAVYKIIKKLRKKGHLIRGLKRGVEKRGGSNPLSPSEINPLLEKIRCHGQQFTIRIISTKDLYHKIRAYNNNIKIGEHNISLYKKSIFVSCNENRYFYGKTATLAFSNSLKYWNKYILELEERLNISLISPIKSRIKLHTCHFEKYDPKLEKWVQINHHPIKIKSTEDNKIWLTMDRSMGPLSYETIHPETSMEDMDNVIEKQFNDWRDNNPPTISEVMVLLKQVIEQNRETATGLNSIVHYMKSQLPKEEKINIDKSIPDYIN